MKIEDQLRVAYAEREQWRESAIELRKMLSQAIEAIAEAHSALDEEREELNSVLTALRKGHV